MNWTLRLGSFQRAKEQNKIDGILLEAFSPAKGLLFCLL
jgi:hypothetical protein